MRLDWVEMREFRNHAHTRLDPLPDGMVVIAGPNGEGKTNLLEGIFFLYSLSSPRVSANEPLVAEGSEAAFLRGEYETTGGSVLVEVEVPRKGASRVKVNRSPVRRRRDLRRQVRAVLFGPFDLPIVIGDPARRRAFLDEAVVALHPVRDTIAPAYEKVLRQRNRLLKEWEGRGVPSGLDAWDEQLVDAGAALIRARADATGRLAPAASEEFQDLAGYELLAEYRPHVPAAGDIEEAFREALARRRPDELVRRVSLVGPHRDDLELAVRDLGARAFGSHGETWAAALCLRLGLASAVEAEIGEPPLVLVDDPFSALDPRRRANIGSRLAGRGGQVLITVADEGDVPRVTHTTYDVHAGSVTRREV